MPSYSRVPDDLGVRRTSAWTGELAVAGEVGAPPIHVAISWLLNRVGQSATSLIPILGPRTREQLDATLGALELRLAPEQVTRLDEASAIAMGTPHEQISSAADAIAGGKPGLLIRPMLPVA